MPATDKLGVPVSLQAAATRRPRCLKVEEVFVLLRRKAPPQAGRWAAGFSTAWKGLAPWGKSSGGSGMGTEGEGRGKN